MRHIILILLASLACANPAFGVWFQDGKSKAGVKQETVYITQTGKRYHRAECRYLHSKIKTNTKKALKAGYTPCKVCKPGGKSRDINATGSTGKVSNRRCIAKTKKGTQCKRSASSNSYCWQHQ